MPLLRSFFIAALLASLSACSVFDRWVYKIDIPQGSHIDIDQLQELQIGMSKPQVEYLLGSPMLTDSFDENRWYYVYRLQDGKSGLIEQEQVVLVFSEERLVAAETDLALSENFNQPYEY